jgi:hypothetical protein
MLLVHSGTVSTFRTRGFPHPAYNLVNVEDGRITVELRIPGGEHRSLGDYPRDWPAEIRTPRGPLRARPAGHFAGRRRLGLTPPQIHLLHPARGARVADSRRAVSLLPCEKPA